MLHARLIGAAVLAVTVVLATSACGSSANTNSSAGTGGTLTIAVTGDTQGLSPVSCAPTVYCFPAYDGLVYQNTDGKFEPDLAAKWDFTDDKHTTLRVSLRQNVKFSDGTAMDAKAVAASLNLFRKTLGPGQANAAPVSDVTVVDDATVDITYATPVTYRYASWQLSAQNGFGTIVGPTGIANPKSLSTASDGVGPYKLSSSGTTKGVQYTYVPNKQYFNQSAIKYDKVVLKPVADASARVNAVTTGQVDWAQGISDSSLQTAKSSGLRISTGKVGSTPSGVPMIVLGKRASGPLASQAVRQAINFATPRSELAPALYGKSATPTSSLVPDGEEGYSSKHTGLYDYDLDRAKELMKQAGYGDGFTITLFDASFFDPGNGLGQAMVTALAKIGITVTLKTSDAPPGDVVAEIGKGTYDAFVWNPGSTGAFGYATVNFSKGAFMNPNKLASDSELDSLVQAAALAPTEQQDAKAVAVTERLDELAWVVPIAVVPTLQAIGSTVKDVPSTYLTRELDPFSPTTSDNWSGGKD